MPSNNASIVPPLISCLVSAITIAAMLGRKNILPLDHPNLRSLHETPIPRIGGVGIVIGLGMGFALAWPPSGKLLLGLAAVLSVLSLVDDYRALSPALRFGVQIAVSSLCAAFLPELPGGLIGVAGAVFALLWMCNLYNFMDGSDGLAGGMAVFGFGFYALAAWHGGAWALSMSSASVATAACGFLLFNFHPARIFMGDSGSVPLGFLAAGLGIVGWQEGLWPASFPLLTFSPFIADASFTLLKRLLRGEKIWQAHREHYYQRLVRMGLGHRGTALAEYGLMLGCGVSAMALLNAPFETQAAVLLAWGLIYALLARAVDKAWSKHIVGNRIV